MCGTSVMVEFQSDKSLFSSGTDNSNVDRSQEGRSAAVVAV